MSSQTEVLEREAEARRLRLDTTLSRLESKFSAGAIVDEIGGYLRSGQGAAMMGNLNRQVRDNPLALGVIGAGVAWLLLGHGVRKEAGKLRQRYDAWQEDEGADALPSQDQEGYYGSADAGLVGRNGKGNGRQSGSEGPAKPGNDDDGSDPSMLERARDTVSGLAEEAKDALHSATDQTAHLAGSTGEWVRNKTQGTRDAAQRVARASRRGGAFVGHEGRELLHRSRRSFLTVMEEQPLVVGAIAIAIGAAIGAALPSTRKEDELMGGPRDRLKDEALDYGEKAVKSAEHVANEAWRAADRKAGEVGLKPEGDTTIAEKVSEVADAALTAAKTDAEKQGLI